MSSIARTIACKSLIEWAELKNDPHQIIAGHISNNIKPEDAAFARELFFGAIKFKRKIDYYYSPYITSKNVELKLKQVLRLGFYQFIQTANIPEYAVVSETVDLARQFCSQRQTGFINAVMRNYLRHPEKVKLLDKENDHIKYLGIEYSYPDWLVKRYLSRFGNDRTIELLKWGNTPPDSFFFANKHIRLENDLEDELSQLNIYFQKYEPFEDYYKCLNPYVFFRSKLFQKGAVIVGDPAQGIAAAAMAVPEGEQVLDLFAAPGGKTAALAGMAGDKGCVYAADISVKRLKILKQNVSRWNLSNVFIFCSDILKFASGRKFKYILADVPCSGTGTIRRNPDLRWNLKEQDIYNHSEEQLLLIREAAGMLKPGGKLVYSTCSLEPEENGYIIDTFLKQNDGYSLQSFNGYNDFKSLAGMYEVMPFQYQTDGSFVAVIEKERT